jgi:hypothetical protein
MAAISGFGCGDDDEGTGPEIRIDGAADAPARDRAVEAAPDASVTEDAANDAAMSGDADASVSPDVDSGRDAGAGADGHDAEASVADGSPTDVSVLDAVVDAAGEQVVTPSDAASDTMRPDSGVAGDSFVAEANSSDAGNDASVADAGDASVSADADAGDELADGGDAFAEASDAAEGSAPERIHWSIEASPPECSADPSADPTAMSCADGPDGYEVYAQTKCPTAVDDADLWFVAGAPPANEVHPVHPAASLNDLVSVMDNEVALVFKRTTPSETWWGRTGTVEVSVVGGRRYYFIDVVAFLGSDHSKTTKITGSLFCASTTRP